MRHMLWPFGRSMRSRFWLVTLIVGPLFSLFILLLIGLVVFVLFGGTSLFKIPWVNAQIQDPVSLAIATSVISFLAGIPNIIVMIRRLHDLDRSGFWSLIAFAPSLTVGAYLFPVISERGLFRARIDELTFLIAGFPNLTSPFTLALAAYLAILLIMYLFLCFAPGTAGPNRYGDDPRYY